MRMTNFDAMYGYILDHHTADVVYTLDDKAQSAYEVTCDNFAEHVMLKYNGEIDRVDYIDEYESNSRFTSPKEVIHILKLAANLHVLKHYTNSILIGKEITKPPRSITKETIIGAQKLLHGMNHHKFTFCEVS
jgi:hypothetical protein